MAQNDFHIGTLRSRKVIAVCCGGEPSPAELELARKVGRAIARRGAILVCGGLGGSMQAACMGAKESGGLTIGILPVYEKNSANKYVDIVIPTGLSHARNNIVVASADGVIGVGGSWGTLSELAIAVKMGKPVAVLESWSASSLYAPEGGMIKVDTPEDAVSAALGG